MFSPLAGRRILVTRAKGQASALAEALAAEGAEPLLIPSIELAPPDSWNSLDAALRSIDTYDWLLFTSANAVAMTQTRAAVLGLTLAPKKIAAIGPATASAVNAAGWKVALVPPSFVAESLAKALLPHARGSRMLLVRAAHARDVVPGAMRDAGAEVTVAEAYRTVVPESSIAALRELFVPEPLPLDAITFTSASTATNLAALLDRAKLAVPPGVHLASIGPVTSSAMRELGLLPTIEAAESTIPALVRAIVVHFRNRPE